MSNPLTGRDIINIRDLTQKEWRYLIDLAAQLKAQKISGTDQHWFGGKNVLANFEWGSTRTRCAFETSCNDLGMGFTYLSNSHVNDTETVRDSIRVFSEMYDLITWRAQKDESYLREIAEHASIPVISAVSLGDHPTQMLADALTMEEQWGGAGSSKGKKMALVGNCAGAPLWYGRLAAMMDMDFYAIQPDNIRHQMCKTMQDDVRECFERWAPNRQFVATTDLDALKGLDVIVTEEWRYLNPECGGEVLDPMKYESYMGDAKDLLPYRVSLETMERTGNPDIFVMHELPSTHNADHATGQRLLAEAPDEWSRDIIRTGFEITDECFEANASVIFREAGNRQHTIKAMMCAVLGI